MNICILSDRFPPHGKGGASRVAADVAAGYRDRGHDVTIISTVRDESDSGIVDRNCLTVHRVVAPKKPRYRAYYSIYNPTTVPDVRAVLGSIRPDAVHAHNVHEFLSYHTLKLAADKSIPVVLTYHDAMSVEYGKVTDVPEDVVVGEGTLDSLEYQVSPWDQLKRNRCRYFPLRNVLNRQYLKRYVDVGVSVSRELATFLTRNGVPCSRVVHNGIDPSPYQNADGEAFRGRFELGDAPTVLFGGRLSYYKGARHLARAFSSVVEEVPEARLVVTGSADGTAERMTRILGNESDSMVTTDWLSEEGIKRAFAAADVVAAPSIYLEPFGLTAAEGMACGTPVVASCFGGTKEIVAHQETGIVLNPFDVDALARALTDLLTDPERRAAYGEAAKQRVEEQFTQDRMVSDYERILTRLRSDS